MHTSIRLHLDLFPNGLTRLLGTSACFPLPLIPVEAVRPQESGISPAKIYGQLSRIQQEFLKTHSIPPWGQGRITNDKRRFCQLAPLLAGHA